MTRKPDIGMKMSKAVFILFLVIILTNINCKEAVDYEFAISDCRNNESNRNAYFYLEECLLGSKLPIFELESINGDLITNTSLEGKYTVINFWFIECLPCIEEIPELNKLVSKYGHERVNFLAIGNNNKKDIDEFIKTKKFNFKHVPSGRDVYRNIFKSLWGLSLIHI